MRTAALCIVLLLWSAEAAAQEGPQVWGYGVKECRSFLTAFEGWESGAEDGIAEYLQYRGWMSGLVTGLSLATHTDILRGMDPNGALRRVRIYCDERPDDDFFTATMDLIRQLGSLGE
jgi:hypothetical protein